MPNSRPSPISAASVSGLWLRFSTTSRDALIAQPAQDAADERHAGDRHRRLGADVGERTQALPDPGRHDERAGRPGGHDGKIMSGDGQAVRLAIFEEQRAIRGADVIVRREPEPSGGRRDFRLGAFQLDEHADRRLVDGDDQRRRAAVPRDTSDSGSAACSRARGRRGAASRRRRSRSRSPRATSSGRESPAP